MQAAQCWFHSGCMRFQETLGYCDVSEPRRIQVNTTRISKVACSPVALGFPAGEPGGQGCQLEFGYELMALRGHHLPEGRLRSGPHGRLAKNEIGVTWWDRLPAKYTVNIVASSPVAGDRARGKLADPTGCVI